MESTSQIFERDPVTLHQDDDEIDLLKLWHVVWQRKWSILALVLAVSMLASLWANSLIPIYRAETTMLIERKAPAVMSIEQLYEVDAFGQEFLTTQVELLKSRALAARVVRDLGLATSPAFDPRQQPKQAPSLFSIRGLWEKLDSGKVLPAAIPVESEAEKAAAEAEIFDSATDLVAGSVSVEPVGESMLVRITVDMDDPQLAATVANAVTRGFIESQLEAEVEMSVTATSWMNSRLGDLRSKLKIAEARLQEYREAENLVDVDGVGTISAAELSGTGDRMLDARRQRAEAESQYRQVQGMQNNWERLASVPAVLGNPLIQTFKGDEARARAKVEELSHRYGAKHPAMLAAQSELTAASASLRSQVEQVVAGIERNYQLAVANQSALQTSLDINKEEVQQIARKEFKLRELQREVDANRELYDTFMVRLKETTATADQSSSNVRVIDPATAPAAPFSPQKSRIVLIAAMLAGMVGVGLTLLLDFLSDTFRGVEEVESGLNLPVLGVLPLLHGKQHREMVNMFSSNEDIGFSESVRTIRTGVLLSVIEHPHKVLLVTSSLPGEGKSVVASNLAFALGHLEKVLLIDADLRRPSIAKSFKFPAGSLGLANLLAGTANLDECIKTVDGIDVMVAGTVPPNPLELISSPRLGEVIKELAGRYQRVIIDSPPTQSVSDAMVLARQVDALIYVIKSDSTHIPLVEKGVGQLLQQNVPIKGIVLNQVNMKKATKYGYYFGHYHDNYGYNEGSAPGSQAKGT